MKHAELIPEFLSLVGGLCLTWPALRAGRVLSRVASLAKGEKRAQDPVSRNIFRRLQAAYLADSWRTSDQRWLWIGLGLTVVGAALSLIAKWNATPPGAI